MEKIYEQQLKPEDYCAELRKIKHSPKQLYFLGDKSIFFEKFFLAVVGARRATAYGKMVLRQILPDIAKRKIVIVSGLAKGIDCLAHEIALEHDCPTIAVMAGGLDLIYPPENKKLAERIIEKRGIIVSEHPPGTQYLRQYFPARNRIISGIADAILVVEAQEKSGALITAKFAFSQGKKVLAVPGSIFSTQSRGVNGLFLKKALPVQKSEDILEVLLGRKIYRKSSKIFEKNNIILNAEEEKILNFLNFNVVTPLNYVIRKTGLSTAKTIAVITQLELKGLVEAVNDGYVKI